jgi:hypothetical protein
MQDAVCEMCKIMILDFRHVSFVLFCNRVALCEGEALVEEVFAADYVVTLVWVRYPWSLTSIDLQWGSGFGNAVLNTV